MNTSLRHPHRAFTITELLVMILAAVCLLGSTIPIVRNVSCDSLRTRSVSNLMRLGSAHASYAVDWNDRQFTVVPDDLASFGSNFTDACESYQRTAGCLPPLILGRDCDGIDRGFFFGCGGDPGGCENVPHLLPVNFTGTLAGRGAFRHPNARGFHDYVGGRFFDPTFYAPKDRVVLDIVEPLFDVECDFVETGDPSLARSSSYVLSPAAMFDPAVLRHFDPADPDAHGFVGPFQFDDGLRSPNVSQALYPAQKSRMLEHHWLQRTIEPCNPAFDPGSFNGCEPYYFNHNTRSNPMTLFYDGHVRGLSVLEARHADVRVQMQAEAPNQGLWSRDSPMGQAGYFGNSGFDNGIVTSYHILTTDGIQGRDTTTSGGETP